MKKIVKILLTLIIIGIFLNITLSRYVEEKSDVSRRIGDKLNGGTMSTSEYAKILEVYEEYTNNLKSGDYEKAYSFLSYEYKQYKTYEDFLKEIKDLNYENIKIEEIIKRTEKMYSVIINEDDIKKENLIIYNSETLKCFIVPEPFLEHNVLNKNLKKKNVEYEVIDTINYIDKFVVNMKITNLSKKDSVCISKFEIINDDGKNISSNLEKLKLEPLEERIVTVTFNTYIEFPNQIRISRLIEKKNLTESYLLDI